MDRILKLGPPLYPSLPVTKDQERYAIKLGIVLPPDCTRAYAGQVISRKVFEERLERARTFRPGQKVVFVDRRYGDRVFVVASTSGKSGNIRLVGHGPTYSPLSLKPYSQ